MDITSNIYTSDRMSAHEKKRYYLEALEQYVIYVHEQLRLVNTEPVPLERVSTYRGMNSRSIRVNIFCILPPIAG